MIYLDTSVALAHLLGEDRRPPESIWQGPVFSSRLLHYEAWTRIHAYNLAGSHAEPLKLLLSHINTIEMKEQVLRRALAPFPTPLRTLDALHLASADFLRAQGHTIKVATYDSRMQQAAQAMGFEAAAC